MTPPTVNASYSSSLNQIQFPAGILQPPFFDPNADDAVNYGAHRRGDRPRDDARLRRLRAASSTRKGNLRDWWTPEDAAKYKAAAQLVVDQFNGYTVVDSASHVNGRLTLGENIADLGGLTVAYFAMEKALGDKPQHEDRRLHAGAALLPRLGADLARAVAPGGGAAAGQDGPALAGQVARRRPAVEHAGVQGGVGCKDGDPMVRSGSLRARIYGRGAG